MQKKDFTDVWAARKSEVLNALAGIAPNTLPVRFWDQHMFFHDLKNSWWRLKTGGFPATGFTSGTHPLFVLRKQGNLGFQVCPCTSKGGASRFIRKGCALMPSGALVDRDSYLVERFSFSLPMSATFNPQPALRGTVPAECIARRRS